MAKFGSVGTLFKAAKAKKTLKEKGLVSGGVDIATDAAKAFAIEALMPYLLTALGIVAAVIACILVIIVIIAATLYYACPDSSIGSQASAAVSNFLVGIDISSACQYFPKAAGGQD